MAIESALSGEGREAGATGERGSGVLVRALLVIGIAVSLALYVLAQYTEHVGKILARVVPNHDVVALLMEVGAALPALLVMPFLGVFIELLWVGWHRSSLRRLVTGNRDSLRDGVYAICAQLPGQVAVKSVSTFGVIYLATKYIQPHIAWNLSGHLPWWPLQYLAVILASTCFQYWQHRILHMVPALWETHKLHHSALVMNLFNYHRESPFTTGVADMVIFVPVVIFGVNESFERGGQLGAFDIVCMALFMSFSVFHMLNQYLIHSEIRSTYGWFGRWVFISPIAHRVHHSSLPQHWDKNFSVDLILWDRLFGTYVECGSEEDPPLGFANNMYNRQNPLIDYFWLPVRDFGRAVVKLARGEMAWIRRGPPT
jgi:sterol desaturase/sphingolipid hydroxylase (fatty acid hydroxylase superfamily)